MTGGKDGGGTEPLTTVMAAKTMPTMARRGIRMVRIMETSGRK
jgi:hypothetical protein